MTAQNFRSIEGVLVSRAGALLGPDHCLGYAVALQHFSHGGRSRSSPRTFRPSADQYWQVSPVMVEPGSVFTPLESCLIWNRIRSVGPWHLHGRKEHDDGLRPGCRKQTA